MAGVQDSSRSGGTARGTAGSPTRSERAASGTPRAAERAVVLYDRDCGFCRWSLARVLDLDRRVRLRPVALQDSEADDLLGGMETERRYASAHLVTPDGEVHSGGAAIAPLLELLPGGAATSPVAHLLAGPLGRGYDLIARNRGLFGRRLSAQARARALAQIDRHAAGHPAGGTDGL